MYLSNANSRSSTPPHARDTLSPTSKPSGCCSITVAHPGPAHLPTEKTNCPLTTPSDNATHPSPPPAFAAWGTGTTLTDVYTSLLPSAQYRRTYAQGCACSTGISGGGCCPSGSATLSAHTGCITGTWQHMWHGIGSLLGALGVYSGAKVISNSLDAIYHLQRMQQHVQQKTGQLRTVITKIDPALGAVSFRQRLTQQLGAYTILQHNLRASLREQYFNLAMPGVVQLCAGAAALFATTAGFVGMHGLHAQAFVFAPALLGIYGVGMAAWQIFKLRHQVDIPKSLHAQIPAMRQHVAAQKHALWQSFGAWSSIGALGIFATANLVHPLGLPMLSGTLVVASLGCALWAMYSSSQTRFVPHIPLSDHVAPPWLIDAGSRQLTRDVLAQQNVAVQKAVSDWTDTLSLWGRVRLQAERLFRPQCGPTSNHVLPQSLGQSTAHQALFQASQIQAAHAWCLEEKRRYQYFDKLLATHAHADDAFFKQLVETHITCCTPADTRSTLSDTAHELLDAQRLRHQLLDKIRALDTLIPTLEKLRVSAGQIQTPTTQMAPDSIHWQWFFARLCLLQLSGTLASALPENFTKTHAEWLTANTTANTWPIDNVTLVPEHLFEISELLAPHMDYGFAHAFFNPRRLEAELDYLNEYELMLLRYPQDAQEDAIAAPACGDRSCCA